MAVTFSDVQKIVETLQEQGDKITVRSVREALGDTGGLQTISKYLNMVLDGATPETQINAPQGNYVTVAQYHALEHRMEHVESQLKAALAIIERLDVVPVPKTRSKAKKSTGAAAKPRSIDLVDFAKAVQEVTDGFETGHVEKVFINHAYIKTIDDKSAALTAMFNGMGFDDFKAHLLEAHKKRLLTLAREDMPSLHKDRDITQSKTTYLNAVYHYVRQSPEHP